MKEVIYSNGSSKTELEFDGEYYSITQTVHGVSVQTVVISKEEIGEIYEIAQKGGKT